MLTVHVTKNESRCINKTLIVYISLYAILSDKIVIDKDFETINDKNQELLE